MMYLLMAIVGAAVGWYAFTKLGVSMNMWICIALGAVGGLIGGAIASLLSFAAVILFQLMLAAVGAYLLVYFIKGFLQKS